MKHLDQTQIFYESDKIQVVAVTGDTVTISVKRNNKPPFPAEVRKSDFSLHVQEHFDRVVPGAWLTRGSCCFHVK